jgi:acyl carrier protein
MTKGLDWSDFSMKIADYTGMEISALKMETNIYSDLGMDSLGLFSLGMYLIKTYDIKIPLAKVAAIETIGDIFILMNSQDRK